MRVLVTGHEGYLGSVLTPLLGLHGHDVRGLDSGLYRECRTGPAVSVPTLRKDIRDVERQDFDDIDVVIHLAGFSNDPLGALDPDLTEKINHGAAVRVGECARAAGVSRLLFASSCSVFGAAGDEFLYEDSPFQPQTSYATSKMRAEQDLSQLATTDFAVTHLRLATIYGGSPFVRFDLVINNLVAWAMTTGKVYLKSDGAAWRPVFHVRDACDAFRVVMEAPSSASGPHVFNVGLTEENYRIRQLAEIVENTLEDVRISYSDQPEGDQRSYRVNCDRFCSAFPSFRPRHSVVDGINEINDLIARVKITPDSFEGPTYRRSDHLLRLRDTGVVDNAFRWIEPEHAGHLAAAGSSN